MERPRPLSLLVVLWVLGSLCLVSGAWAQDGDEGNPGAPVNAAVDAPDAGNAAQEGPVRLVRFAYVQGDVNWRGDKNSEWAPASRNLPIRQGAQVWVQEGRAELQFDDGSRLRLGSGALITLPTLYSDSQGEFTEISMTDGVLALRLKSDHSIYQVNTPLVSLKSVGPAGLRVGTGDGVEVAIEKGTATVEGDKGKATLEAGDYLNLQDASSPYDPQGLPRPDSFDAWNVSLDREQGDMAHSATAQNLPPDLDLVTDDLDAYGTWSEEPSYGHVWYPRVTVASWRPYHYGHWVWVQPFGWTWVADGFDAGWGWVPYHYGTWVHLARGWGWVPGPAIQYWSPGVVSFYSDAGEVAWCPLAPAEVRYPAAINFGFRGGNWAFFFSIGGACAYYPAGVGIFVGHPWHPGFVNRAVFVNNVTVINNHNTFLAHGGYVPVNARLAAGATAVGVEGFGGHGIYRALPRGETTIFTHGSAVGAPTTGRPVVGPPSVHPTPLAFSPSRTFVSNAHPDPTALSRPVFRMPVRSGIAQTNRPTIGAGTVPRAEGQTGRTPTFSRQPSGGDNAGRFPGSGNGVGFSREAQAAQHARESLGMHGSASGGGESGGTRTPSGTFDRSRSSSGDFQGRGGSNEGSGRLGGNGASDAASRARRSLGWNYNQSDHSYSPRERGSSSNTPDGSGLDSSRSWRYNESSHSRSDYSPSGRGGDRSGGSFGGGGRSSGSSSSGSGRSSNGGSSGNGGGGGRDHSR